MSAATGGLSAEASFFPGAREGGEVISENRNAAQPCFPSRKRALEQRAHRGREQIYVTLEVIAPARETTARARDVGGDRRLLCDDEFFSHGARKAGDDKCKPASGSTVLRQ